MRAGLALLAAVMPALCQQTLDCYQMREKNAPGRRALWDGYEVSLGPTPTASAEPERACTVAIYNRAGHMVFRSTGFSTVLNPDGTGLDIDGDGKRDVVLSTDTGGGQHCCREFDVISLSPKPHKLAHFYAPGAVNFDEDSRGRTVIWVRTAGPSGFTTSARRPFAERVLRLDNGKLISGLTHTGYDRGRRCHCRRPQ